MVSKASEDLPEPLRPVITVRVLRGISTEMFFRLCWRAPRTVILLIAMDLMNLGNNQTLNRYQDGPYSGSSEGQCAALLRILNAARNAVNRRKNGVSGRSFGSTIFAI